MVELNDDLYAQIDGDNVLILTEDNELVLVMTRYGYALPATPDDTVDALQGNGIDVAEVQRLISTCIMAVAALRGHSGPLRPPTA